LRNRAKVIEEVVFKFGVKFKFGSKDFNIFIREIVPALREFNKGKFKERAETGERNLEFICIAEDNGIFTNLSDLVKGPGVIKGNRKEALGESLHKLEFGIVDKVR
jgi:hypothetical protein